MSSHRKQSSIAQKLNGSWLRSLFFSFIVLDLMLLGIGILLWFWLRNQGILLPKDQMWTVVQWGGGTILIIELVLLLRQSAVGHNRARTLLQPLYDMAETTAELSSRKLEQVQQMEAERFRAVEDAIERINPKTKDARLETGDADLKGLEAAVNNLLQRMHDSYRQQVRFVSDASHELRTPIAVIQGYANMLDRWGKQDATILDEGIQAIKTESETMNRLVEQLLFLARGDSGRQPMQMGAIDARELLETIAEEYQMIDTSHLWKLESTDGILVRGDDAMLKQAVRILIDNAIKYTPEGGQIRLRLCKVDPQYAAFEVTDQGIGIRKEDVSHVFERFYRADPARDRKSGGSGLGLSIAEWIVQQHNGYLNVLSHEDLGTRIALVVPIENGAGSS